MNVYELIEKLNKIDDKSKSVWISFDSNLGTMPVGYVSETERRIFICEPGEYNNSYSLPLCIID